MPIHHSVFNHPFETKHQEIDWIDGLPFSPIYDDRFFQADAIKEIKDTSIKIALESVKKIITTTVDKSKLDNLFEKNLEEAKSELKKINS